MTLLDFLRELSVSLRDAKTVGMSGIGVIGLKVIDIFEGIAGVRDDEKGTGEVTMSFTGVFKNLSWWSICKIL